MNVTKKPVVLIVECVSSSINYLKDITALGYEPVCLELQDIKKQNPDWYFYTAFGAKKPKTITSCKHYDDTLARVKKLNPIAIVTGEDYGIDLTLRLCRDLKLPNNKVEDLPKLKDKYVCQEQLKKAKLRHIHTIRYTTWDKAVKFFKQHNNKVVVKPDEGTSTVGVTICENIKTLKKAISLVLHEHNLIIDNKPLIQEFIGGEEFVVNSISCKGQHVITSVYRYHKRPIPGAAPVYVYTEFISPSSKIAKPMVKYNLKVLDALNVKYGPCHAEFKIDKKGPVLIEVNCRIPGGSMPASYLDKVYGHHETNLSLTSALHPNKFLALKNKQFEPIAYAVLKHIILNKDLKVKGSRLKECFGKLPSFHFCHHGARIELKPGWMKKTVDYETCGGSIFLVNKNKKQLLKDLDYITHMEQKHLEDLYILDKPRKKKA